jgi:hypothetical protein
MSADSLIYHGWESQSGWKSKRGVFTVATRIDRNGSSASASQPSPRLLRVIRLQGRSGFVMGSKYLYRLTISD